MTAIIHWFRRDLRLSDNAALHAACRASREVIPVFIFDPAVLRAPEMGAPRLAFLLECLESLRKNIEAAGGRLILREGETWEVLRSVSEKSGAKALYFNRDYEPRARERDARAEAQAKALGWDVRSFKDDVIQEGDEILKADGKPYVVFTPYAKVWRTRPIAAPLGTVKFASAPSSKIESMPMPSLAKLGFTLDATIPAGGEKEGCGVLKKFVESGLFAYRSQRDFPAIEGVSKLSPHLAFGTVSPRTVLAAVDKARTAHPQHDSEMDTFVSEIIWREFYRQVLWHYPHVATGCFRPQYDALKWENNEKYFAAWCAGRTGFPIVDAAMRQLNQTGWMHNRLRMIVAMFLTKDLLVSWQWGERYFMQKLVDADLASNNGGWQWSAGTGTDAAPYFRIFNPNSQAAKFDPEGKFITRYLPEADSLSYVAPIVDHATQRVKALEMYRRGR